MHTMPTMMPALQPAAPSPLRLSSSSLRRVRLPQQRAQLRNGRCCAAGDKVDLLVLDFDCGLSSADKKGLQARGLPNALQYTSLPFYVLADNPKAAAETLREDACVDLPPARLAPRTADALAALAERPLAQQPTTSVHLISSDPALLATAAALPALASWRLHAATWGGAAPPPAGLRAGALALDSLVELLSFGLLMGVGDGCQEKFASDGTELESN